MRFGVYYELVHDMVKPLVEILHFFFLLHLKTTQFFQQHGGGFVINKFLKENSLEHPPF